MAARRRYVRRRAPLRRYRRAVRKTRRLRKKFSRRRRTGNFTLLCRKVSVIAVPGAEGYSYQVAPTLNDYAEVQPFLNNFEAYRIWNVKVKITPLFNVAESGNPVPKYYSAPWHRPGPVAIASNSILSLDRAKSHNGTTTTFRRYAPCILTSIGIAGDTTQHLGKTEWKPKIAIQTSSTTIPHYAALYHWSQDQIPGPQAVTRQYELEISSVVTLYNQKNFAG